MPGPAVVRVGLDDWRAAGRTFGFRGHAVFVRESGDVRNEPLLLIHGFPSASWDWADVWPGLAARWPLLAPDLLGFGWSAKPVDHDYTIAGQADLCEALLMAEGVGAYHVLAHDYGDTVAQELLARQSDGGERPRLRSVMFLNGGLFPETHRPLLVQRLLRTPLGPWVARRASRASFGGGMTRIFGRDTPPDAALLDGLWTLLDTHDGRAVMPKLIRYIDERRAFRARWVGALQYATVPLALVDGAADPISGAHMAARWRALVPHGATTLLDGIGHYPQIEAPEAVLAAYLAFRAGVDASPA